MADAPTIGRKGVSLDVAAFFRRYAALTALIVLLAFNFAVTPNFASWQTLNVNLTQVATIVIVSVGMTLVIATGGIDLSVGSLMAISGALAPMIFLSSFGLSYPALGNALAFVVAGRGRGPVRRVQRLVHHPVPGPADRRHARHVHRRPRHRPGADQRQSAGVQEPDVSVHRPRAHLRRALPGHHHAGAGRRRRLDAAHAPCSAARSCRSAATSGRRGSAGVPVASVKRWVYAISGLCAGIAGLVVVSINSSSDANLVGLGMELDAIAAVAVGGTPFTGGQATVVGSLIGALLIQLVRYTLLANGVPDAAALVVKGAIIAGAVWSQQRGRST